MTISLNMPASEYHSSEGISKTGLWTLLSQSPAHYIAGRVKRTAEMDMGSAVHAQLLQPHEQIVVCGPEDRRGSKWKDALAAVGPDQVLLPEKDYDRVMRVVQSVRTGKHSHIVNANNAEREVSVFFEISGIKLRCRPDLVLLDDNIIIDVKTTKSANRNSFARDCYTYGYHMQAALYAAGWAMAGGGPEPEFKFLCVELDEPYATALYTLDRGSFQAGQWAVRKALRLYEQCVSTGQWPGYTDDTISLPRWAFQTMEMDDAA
jgi:exodeoxyribonuclease VIII